MPDHLILPPATVVGSRRVPGAGGATPVRNRQTHGRHLSAQMQTIVQAPRRIDAGVDPDLVFKIRSTSRPQDSAFAGRGLEMLSETRDFTYFVLSHDEGRQLRSDLTSYTQSSTLKSFFDSINEIEPYGPEDRIGEDVFQALGSSPNLVVDIVVWPSSDYTEAQRRADVVEGVVRSHRGLILLKSVTTRRSVLRVEVSQASLDDLLSVSVVETIRLPPVPFVDFREWRSIALTSLTVDHVDSSDIGLLDDLPGEGHPLLSGLVLSSSSTAPTSYPWQIPGNHGTEVAGRLLYSDLAHNIRDASALIAKGGVRSMRILEPNPNLPDSPPRFAQYDFPHNIVAASIRQLNEEHGVKVFNLSVGYSEAYNDAHLGPLTEIIDELIRELDIVVVVPTGNAALYADGRSLSGHHVIDDKPAHFFSPENRLSEPGPAALAVTVGSIALSGAQSEMSNRFAWQAVAKEDEVSPFSRSGPGIGTRGDRQNKPDLVHYGGNFVLNDSGQLVLNEPGAGIVVPSLKSPDQLFASVNGTSFAVPAVARVAADVAHAYPDASANLIRVLLATGAVVPDPARLISQGAKRSSLYGYGRPSSSRAVESGGQRATMTFDGDMAVDSVSIHPIPIPREFRSGNGGERSIQVALAFDPPVRRQRREYLAASMKFDIFRQIPLSALKDMLAKQDPADAQPLVNDRRRLKLLPGSTSMLNSTLQVRSWSGIHSFVNDDDVFYLTVTHSAQTWARSDPSYSRQRYALAVTLEDHHLVGLDLHQLLTQRVSLPARARIRN